MHPTELTEAHTVMASTSVETRDSQALKRKISGSASDDSNSCKYYITLAKEDEFVDDTGSESIYTIQGKSTIIVEDPSDTEWSDSEIEYEVRSPPDYAPDHPFMYDRDNSSSSEESDAGLKKLDVLTDGTRDEDCVADDSSDSGTLPMISDPELSPADFWKCAQCNAKNNNPLFRYCERCFKVRKEFFPARPKGHKKRSLIKPNSQVVHSKFSDSDSEKSDTIIPSDSQTLVSSQNFSFITESLSSDSEQVPNSSSSKVRDYVKQVSLSTDSGLSDVVNDCHFFSDEENRKCNICFKNAKNAGFFHGNKVHVYCCYKCAKKVWLYFKKCPVCNRRVSCVVRLIYS